jgi:hypothetical protein
MTDNGTLSFLSQGKAVLDNVLVPWIFALEGSRGGGGEGGEGGGLSPEAAASRCKMCVMMLSSVVRGEETTNSDILMGIVLCLGTMLDTPIGEASDHFGLAVVASPAINQAPAVMGLLLKYYADATTEGKAKPCDWVSSDPFLSILYRARSCSTCGLLPGEPHLQFQVCSLCKDPAVGHFCCKEPCFAAFWRAGHKNTCAGRDKQKKKGKGGGGGGGGGAGSSGVAG